MRDLIADARVLLADAWRLNPRRVATQLALMLTAGVVGGANLLLLVPIVNAVADPGSTIDIPVVGPLALADAPLPVLLAAFGALGATQALLTRAATLSAVRVEQQIVDELRQEAFEAVLAARWSFVLTRRSSDIIEVVTTGAYRCGMAYEQLLRFGIAAVMALATALVALIVSPLVTALALLGVAGLGAAMSASVRAAYRLGEQFSEQDRHLQGVMTDSMSSLRLVRAHDASAVWAERLAEAFTGTRAVEVAHARRQATVSAASQVGLAVAAAGLVLLAVWQEVPAPSIAVILVLVARLARIVQGMAATAASLAYALPAVRDLAELTGAARDAVEVPPGAASARVELGGGPADAGPSGSPSDAGPSPSPSDAGPSPAPALLEFQGVSFTYPNSDAGVRDLHLVIPRGTVTVVTGASGAGKSTTADLALGLLTPQAGRILVDGQPLVPADLPWWRRHVAYVPQETVLVPGTLRDNLAWSVPGGASDEACWRALDQAAATFVRELPNGLDTLLGDRGLRLSGGERQRVAIARALLRDPALLVLDEATSALDDHTEAAVLDLVAGLGPEVTVLVIAHRASTIERAQHRVELAARRTTG
jgi:ATP-binding cassette subfamily C protein